MTWSTDRLTCYDHVSIVPVVCLLLLYLVIWHYLLRFCHIGADMQHSLIIFSPHPGHTASRGSHIYQCLCSVLQYLRMISTLEYNTAAASIFIYQTGQQNKNNYQPGQKYLTIIAVGTTDFLGIVKESQCEQAIRLACFEYNFLI